MFFDTHAHLDDEAFEADREEMIRTILEAGVKLVLNPGCDVMSSRRAMALSEAHEEIFFAAGIHPEELQDFNEAGLNSIFEMSEHPKCVAIGEIGLDYYWDDTHKEEQKALLQSQLVFASENDLPVIIHDREAHGDCLASVKQVPGLRGVFHCYSGSPEMAEELLRMGWYLGFDGPITYKNARRALEVIHLCPLDRILIETDSPYLSPVPRRGKRNDPSNLRFICEKIAEIKGLKAEEIAAVTAENGRRLFQIPG